MVPPTFRSVAALAEHIERSLGPMTLTDRSGTIVAASRGIAELLGYDHQPSTLRGLPAADFVLDGAHDGEHEQDGVATVRRRDGSTFRFAYHVRPVVLDGAMYFLADGHVYDSGEHPDRQPEAGPDAWLTRAEAARRARVSVRTIDRAIASAELQAAHVGRAVRIRRRWLDAWLGMLLG